MNIYVVLRYSYLNDSEELVQAFISEEKAQAYAKEQEKLTKENYAVETVWLET